MLSEWSWHKKRLWVDKEKQCLTCGGDSVLEVGIVDGALTISYGDGWEDYIFSTEHPDNVYWKDTLQAAGEKLKKKVKAAKGLRKGKSTK